MTRRCAQRQFLLRPSPITNRLALFCLAYAAAKHGIELHAFCVLSNHYHLVLTDPRGELPEFMHRFDLTLAKSINAHLGRWENVFSTDRYSGVELLDDGAVLEKIVYTLMNPVRAGLVRWGDQWPGLRSRPTDVRGKVHRATRTGIYFRREGSVPEEAALQLSVPPGFAGTSAEEFARLLETRIAEEERVVQATFEREGRAFVGKKGVAKVSPYDAPKSRPARRRMNPRVACSNKWQRIAALQELKKFGIDYRRALDRFRAGDRESIFPAGTYWMRVSLGVACEPVGRGPP